ncbi:rab GTPase activator, putative [Babesia caballi]|uniref:Rab GTPase activator, putative n=1 Tax=Babesia caballi TaxID=5871 RepID=A0AAV4M1J4_BABCB|nr:rab GTPase activator, putative [Babesia caballi]
MGDKTADSAPLVDTEAYKRWRSPEINEAELSVWSADMFKYGISTSYESYGSLKTAIRRGVPDILKHYIWIKANGADRFYLEHPNFYKHSFTTTFGQNVPEVMGEDCPTFCGGILGLQTDIMGTPIRARDIDFDATSLDADSLHDSMNRWHQSSDSYRDENSDDASDYEPLDRGLSVTSLPDSYHRHKTGTMRYHMGSLDDEVLDHRRPDGGVWHSRRAFELPDVLEESAESDRRDPLDQYLSELHDKHRNPMLLLHSTKRKIRERQASPADSGSNPLRNRQYSDLMLVTGDRSLPSAPLHHNKLIANQMSPNKSGGVNQIFPKTSAIIKLLRDREQKHPVAQPASRHRPFSRLLQCCRWFCFSLGKYKQPQRRGSSHQRLGSFTASSSGGQSTFIELQSRGSSATELDPKEPASGSARVNFSDKLDFLPYEARTATSASGQSSDEPVVTDTGYYRFPSTAVDHVLVRRATTRVLYNSVYKLSDVTDFTSLLTPSGVNEVKRILWCLNTSFSAKIEFLPVVPSLCCLLLVYMAPEAVLCVLHCLMTRAVESRGRECGERFLFVDREGFVTFVNYVLSVMKHHLRNLVGKMQLLNVDLAAWIARAVQSGFSHMLPFDYILRIYGDFLFEGEIVLCRYCIALVKFAHDVLIKCNGKGEAEEALYRIGLDRQLDIDQLTKLAYSFRLKFYKSDVKGYATTPYLMPVKIKTFYRPRLGSFSRVVREHKWEVIWAWLLPGYRILDPQKIYSSDSHGTSMLGLVKTIKDSGRSGVSALLFIGTTAGDVFGVFIPTISCELADGLFTSQRTSDQMDSFVFTLKPKEQIYNWSGQSLTGVKSQPRAPASLGFSASAARSGGGPAPAPAPLPGAACAGCPGPSGSTWAPGRGSGTPRAAAGGRLSAARAPAPGSRGTYSHYHRNPPDLPSLNITTRELLHHVYLHRHRDVPLDDPRDRHAAILLDGHLHGRGDVAILRRDHVPVGVLHNHVDASPRPTWICGTSTIFSTSTGRST